MGFNFPAGRWAVRETLRNAKMKLVASLTAAKKREALKNGKGKKI